MIKDGKTGKYKPSFEDQTLVCIDCGQAFTWSVGEQRFYFSKSLSAPRRCHICRAKRKATLVPDEATWETETTGWRADND